jgi:predicted membrane protein DUF2207
MSLATPTPNNWLNVPAKSREVVAHHFGREWSGRPLYLMISGGVAAIVAGVWIFLLAKAVGVPPPESLLHGKRAPGMRNGIRILVALCALFTSLSLRCSAQSQVTPSATEEILDYHSDIRVQQDASLRVRETIRVRSAGVQIHHGIYRDFPTRYKDQLGDRYVVKFEIVEVSRDGQPEKFHVQDQNNGERIYFGDEKVILPPGEYTYALVYTANREVGFFVGRVPHVPVAFTPTGSGQVGLLISR